MNINFKPWKTFTAFKDDNDRRIWLHGISEIALEKFKRGMRSPKSGRVYSRGGRRHRASAAGEYPAVDSGALLASVDTEVTTNKMTIGTGRFYAAFLRNGTSKMRRRKMSDNALQEALDSAPRMRHFARWKT